jgi:hypothetical protein
MLIKPNSEQSEDGKPRLRAETRCSMWACLQAQTPNFFQLALRRAGTGPIGIAGLPKQRPDFKPVAQLNPRVFYLNLF